MEPPQRHREHRERLSGEATKSQRTERGPFLGIPKKTSVLSVPLWLTSLCALRGRSASGYIVPAVPGIATGGTGIGPNSSVCGIRLKGAGQELIEDDGLAGVGRHPAHDRRERALGDASQLVERLAVADAGDQVDVLLLVRVRVLAGPLPGVGSGDLVAAPSGSRRSPWCPDASATLSSACRPSGGTCSAHGRRSGTRSRRRSGRRCGRTPARCATWRPPMPTARTGWPPIAQLTTSRLWTCCSTMWSPESQVK